MPFNQNVGVGYAITLATQILGVLIIGGIICLINTLFFGICCYIDTFIQDLIGIFDKIDKLWTQANNFTSIKSSTFSLFREFLMFNEDVYGW